MQLRYEILILAGPDVSQDEIKGVEKSLSDAIVDAKGAVVSFERWGKYQLAYPIKGQTYGVYFLMRFEVPSGTNVIDEIKTLFTIRLNTLVMRFMISVLEADAPLTYQRPRSLEEAPPARETSGGFGRNERRFSYDRPDNDASSSEQDEANA